MIRTFFALLLIPFTSFAETTVHKIGAIIPLTGPAAYAGEACRNGIEMAKESLSEIAKKQIEILYEDDANTPRKTAEAYQKLKLDNPTVYLTFTSSTSLAISNQVEKDERIQFAIASDPKITLNKKYIFNLWVTPETEMKKLIPYLIKQRWSRIALISAQHDGVFSFRDAFKNQTKGIINTVLEDEVTIEEKNFKPFLMRLKQIENVDAIFVNLWIGQTGLFARQAREMKINLPLFNGEIFENTSEVTDSKGALIGQAYVQAGDAGDVFLNSYHAKFPKASPVGAAHCHDVVSLLGEAIDKGKISVTEMREHFATLSNFSGALGTYSTTGDNRFTLPAVLRKVTATGFEDLKE